MEDEPSVRRFLRGCLNVAGFETSEVSRGAEAIEEARQGAYQGILLDLGLPDIDGLEVLRRVRSRSAVPIVVVSLRDSEEEIVDALDAGADDYLVKPFGVKELLARLRAALRRGEATPHEETVFRSGGLAVDLARREVFSEGQPVSLTPTEWELITVFVRNAGRVLTHARLLELVWGPQYIEDLQLLRVNVSNLRRKLEPDSKRPTYIVTELAVGYRFRVRESKES